MVVSVNTHVSARPSQNVGRRDQKRDVVEKLSAGRFAMKSRRVKLEKRMLSGTAMRLTWPKTFRQLAAGQAGENLIGGENACLFVVLG